MYKMITMKLYPVRNYLFFFFLLFNLKLTFGDSILDTNSYYTYDVVQLAQKIIDNIRATETFATISSSSDKNDVLEDAHMHNFYASWSNVYKNTSNSKCLLDLLYVVENIKQKDIVNSWALQMLDSNGKLESGVLEGNFKWLGEFNECIKVYAPKRNFSSLGGFHGQYCNLNLFFENTSYPLSIGLCFPDTCDPSDLIYDYFRLMNITKAIPFLNKLGSEIKPTLTCKPTNTRKLTDAMLGTIYVLSVFVLLALIGSFITAVKYIKSLRKRRKSLHDSDVIINYDSEKQDQDDFDDVLILTDGSRTKLSVFMENCNFFFNCFCIFTNGSKILNTDAVEGQFLCLHGIRFLSMTWIILGHSYVFSFYSVRNMKEVLGIIDNWPFQAILNGFFSVDSFFLLSAFLVTYLYLREANKRTGKVSWIYFYVHRYIRLTPVYALVIAFFTAVYPYISSGPLWPDYDIEPICQKHWWWNLLYINNFEKSTEMCMPWSWYLANDMQFYIISPLFLITIWRWPRIGYSIVALFFCGSWISAFVISYHYNLSAGVGDVTKIASDVDFMTKWANYFDKFYIRPYTRIGPYLVGICLANILFKRRMSYSKSHCLIILSGWIAAAALGLSCVYGIYHRDLSIVTSSFYNAFSHTSFTVCLAWVIFVCLTGQGGFVDKILSYKLFIPLSRLTYCAYLIHPIIIFGYFSSMKTTFQLTHSSMVLLFLGLLLVTYAVSFMVSLIFEAPVIRLEKFIRSKFET